MDNLELFKQSVSKANEDLMLNANKVVADFEAVKSRNYELNLKIQSLEKKNGKLIGRIVDLLGQVNIIKVRVLNVVYYHDFIND